MGTDIRTFVADDLWLLVAIATFALTSLVGIAGFSGLAGAISIVGWFLLTPVFLFWGEEIAAAVWGTQAESATTESADDDPIEELKRRYAEGAIDDAEFERRLDRLLETDDAIVRQPLPRDPAGTAGGAMTNREPGREPGGETNRESEPGSGTGASSPGDGRREVDRESSR